MTDPRPGTNGLSDTNLAALAEALRDDAEAVCAACEAIDPNWNKGAAVVEAMSLDRAARVLTALAPIVARIAANHAAAAEARAADAEAQVERVRALADSMEREAPKPQAGGFIAEAIRDALAAPLSAHDDTGGDMGQGAR